jgi:tRNA modification GTPase
LGIIDARGDEELSAALIQLAGGLARPLQSLRDNLLQLLADLEAGLDFVEEDIEFVAREEVLDRLRLAEHSLHEVAQQMASRSTAAQTAQVALIGPSNVGKSSLFNALVARFALDPCSSARTPLPALVSPRRGTTRDYLTATIDLGGLRCELVDTAGVDESFDAIQSSPPEDARSMIDTAAQALAKERRKRAAIRIWCVEASEDLPLAKPGDSRIAVVAWTKSDVCRPTSKHRSELPQHAPFVITSSRTGEGLDELRVACRQLLRDGAVAQHGQVVDVTAERCRESIRLAQAALQRAMEIAVCHGGDELLTAELRNALAELGKVVGAVYTDDLLDRIFSSFCIGK